MEIHCRRVRADAGRWSPHCRGASCHQDGRSVAEASGNSGSRPQYTRRGQRVYITQHEGGRGSSLPGDTPAHKHAPPVSDQEDLLGIISPYVLPCPWNPLLFHQVPELQSIHNPQKFGPKKIQSLTGSTLWHLPSQSVEGVFLQFPRKQKKTQIPKDVVITKREWRGNKLTLNTYYVPDILLCILFSFDPQKILLFPFDQLEN